MGWSEVTPPVGPAINVQELRDHLRVTNPDEDRLIQLYADAATRIAEKKTRRALINRTIAYEMTDFPDGDWFDLPVAPVSTLTSIYYYDTGGNFTLLDPSWYLTDLNSVMPVIYLALGKFWPPVYPRTNAVKSTFTAGYGTDYRSVPEGLRLAVMMLAAHFYENRTPVEVGSGTVANIPMTLQYALDAYRIASP